MRALVQQFSAQSPHTIRVVTGSTGKLYSQIFHGAPFDAFLSADQTTPARLNQDGLTVANSTFTYTEGRLIFWRRSGSRANGVGGDNNLPPWDAIKRGDFSHIAIANPKLAPYGAAAVETLTRLGLLAELQPRIVQGDSVGQTYQFVASENAQLGFVALSQVHADGRISQGSGWLVPASLHQPIRQDAVLLKAGQGNPAASALLTFLRGDKARAVIRSYGYEI